MELTKSTLDFLAVLSIISGVLECFWGYRLYKFIIGFSGFVIGALLIGAGGFLSSGGNHAIALVSGVIGGLIGAALAIGLLHLGLFALGFLFGGLLGSLISSAPALIMIFGALGGFSVLAMHKLMIIVATSFAGAYQVVIGVAHFIGVLSISNIFSGELRHLGGQLYVMILIICLLSIVGFVFQYRAVRFLSNEVEPNYAAQGSGLFQNIGALISHVKGNESLKAVFIVVGSIGLIIIGCVLLWAVYQSMPWRNEIIVLHGVSLKKGHLILGSFIALFVLPSIGKFFKK